MPVLYHNVIRNESHKVCEVIVTRGGLKLGNKGKI